MNMDRWTGKDRLYVQEVCDDPYPVPGWDLAGAEYVMQFVIRIPIVGSTNEVIYIHLDGDYRGQVQIEREYRNDIIMEARGSTYDELKQNMVAEAKRLASVLNRVAGS